MTEPKVAYAVGLVAAAGVLQLEARKHEISRADLEAEGYGETDEALLHSIQAESLRALAEKILDMPNPYGAPTVTAAQPEITF